MRWLPVVFLLSSCAVSNPYYDAGQAHHTPTGFQNTEPFTLPSSTDIMRWYWYSLISPTPAHNTRQVPWQTADLNLIKQPQHTLQATWLGHAGVLIQSHGINVLTDPVFAERASPFSWAGPKRQTKAPLAITDLPSIDVIVISHNHYDHLDIASLKAIDRQQQKPPLIVVPLGNAGLLRRSGIRQVIELDWWQSVETSHEPAMTITLTPARHWSIRQFFPSDKDRSLWGSYVLSHAQHHSFFAGDTGYASVFKEIGNRFGPFDLAILPIGAYEPREYLKAQHLNPADAVQVHQDLRARNSMPIHWGTFILSSELLQQPPDDLAQALDKAGIEPATFQIWAIGETKPITTGF